MLIEERVGGGKGWQLDWAGAGLTLVALLGGSGHGALDGLDALVDGVPGGRVGQ